MGWLIKNKMIYPDLFAVLKTCKQTLTEQHKQLLFDNFPILYQTTQNKGHIPEEMFNQLNFPMYTNYVGEEGKKNAGFSQENQQNAKNLNHQ